MWFVYLVIAIIALIVDWMLAEEFYSAACAKGYAERKYFWWAFLTGLPGYLLVVALPRQEQTWAASVASPAPAVSSTPVAPTTAAQRSNHISPTPAEEQSVLASGGWKCTCGRVNAHYVSTCCCGVSRSQLSAKHQQ